MSRNVLIFLFLTVFWSPSVLAFSEGKLVSGVGEAAVLYLDSKEEVRLAGIVIPEAYQSGAVDLLKGIAIGPVVLHYGNNQRNRYGQLLAQVYNKSGEWLQQLLLEKGYAYVYVIADNDLLAAKMLAIEEKARAGKQGLWQSSEMAVLSAAGVKDRAEEFKGRFVIVEGTVAEVKHTKKRTYINFDADWKTDFTASIQKEYRKAFKAVDLEALVGKAVRVRGWIESYNGPFMELYHASHVEVM